MAINDDTFTTLGLLWAEGQQEVFAAQTRHMDRMTNILEHVEEGGMTEADAHNAARRSYRLLNDRREFLSRYYAQKMSDELALWLF
jgi:hypothetical protein